MSLGPNFISPHLPQLLILWCNTLLKPMSKEGMVAGSRHSVAEWMFLLHVRESALSAILYFLQHNSGTLVTLDVARQIASVLGNALSFANAFITLGFSRITKSTQVTLLQLTIALFASPDGYAGSSMQAAITSSSSSFTSVWQCGNGYAYSVTHLDIKGADTAAMDMAETHVQLRRPILGQCKHDLLLICQFTLINTEYYIPEPAPPSTAVVDAAITLFSQLLLLQNLSSSAKIIGLMSESTRLNKFEKNLGRKAGTNFLTSQMKSLVVVNNWHPYRCASMASGSLLKTMVNVLISLSNDTHPLIHFGSLCTLAQIINAASSTYAPPVPGMLGMLLRIYCMDSHEREGGTLANTNMSGDFPAYPVVCQILDTIITVLGPDIQESPCTQALILNLVQEFSAEGDDNIQVESIQCIQHFLVFTPKFIDIPSINALYQLVQKDVLVMSQVGGDQLVEDLFGMLNDNSGVEGIKNVITSCNKWLFMSQTTASQEVANAASRQNMHNNEVCTTVAKSSRREQLDPVISRNLSLPTTRLLVSHVPDLSKMAFMASTVYITEIRLEGLVVLRNVIEMFSKVTNPPYKNSLLLKQHQMLITTPLTSLFSSDSMPKILDSAMHATKVAAMSASTHGQLVFACLQALKYLVMPEYCRKAVMEPMVFEELLNLCYHMAMMESANIHIALTGMLLSWALSQDKGSKMLMAAFTAFATIAASVKSSQREDVKIVLLQLQALFFCLAYLIQYFEILEASGLQL
ncbi:hypothetical protein BDN71DRAFT_1570152 [Pleurotus eryngii]|uniref:Uncharacterized protein n=1 Tax=Pleurotus eryngii TaxID=5323 RepID=A0A9P5ZSQ0_PLEER|nr:hypothetical protein BDN71DRAFT_1570152 [Pleurotus eryngii]